MMSTEEEIRSDGSDGAGSWIRRALHTHTLLFHYIDERQRYRQEGRALEHYMDAQLREHGRLVGEAGDHAVRWAQEVDRGRHRVTTWGLPWTLVLELDPAFSGAGAWVWLLGLVTIGVGAILAAVRT